MKISIVIPNYNGEKYFKKCIESIILQNFTDYELIVIDNASTDSDYSWIKEDQRIIFKKLDKNYGFSKAVNEGIKLSKAEYVLLLNNDTVLKQDFLAKLLETIEKDKNIFAVSSKMIQYNNQDLIDDAGDEYNIFGWAYKVGDGKSIKEFTTKRNIFSACAGAALYRKSAFEKIGYFDEDFFAYMEDIDISYRARIYGYKNVYCPEAHVYHIGSATTGSKYNEFKVKLAARNNIYVPYKNMPLLQLIVNTPFLFLGFSIKYIFFKRKGFEKEYTEGLLDGIKSLGKIKKVKFELKHIFNYVKIEILLIKNTITYIISKLVK